jgi:hypothetical protein
MSTTIIASAGDSSQQSDKERRRSERWNVFEIAPFIGERAPTPCVVDNLSEGGALVSTDLAVLIGETTRMGVEGFGSIPAKILRFQGNRIALEFLFETGQAERFRDWLAGAEKKVRT